MNHMKLTALQYGTTALRESCMFPHGSPDICRPISLLFFLVETEGRRILVDTGCDTMPGFPLYTHEPPVQTPARLGLSPANITDVILTHGHGDHAQCACCYPDALFWLHQEALPKVEKFLPPNPRLQLFADTAQPVSGMVVRHIGGHAAGSCVVELGSTVLCGDECYSRENLQQGIPTGSTVCPEKSLAFIRHYGAPPWRPIIFHDPDLVGAIGIKSLPLEG